MPRPAVKRGDIADGLSSVAHHLGLAPEKTAFIHSSVLPPDDPRHERAGTALAPFPLRHEQMTAYLPRRTDAAPALAVLFAVPDAHVAYLERAGLAVPGSLCFAGPRPTSRAYPEASVSAGLRARLAAEPGLAASLAGRMLVSSFTTVDDEMAAVSIGAGVLMGAHDQAPFGSKTLLRRQAAAGGYDVPPGVAVTEPAAMDEALDELRSRLAELGDAHPPVWFKRDFESSGVGSRRIEGTPAEVTAAVRDHVAADAEPGGRFRPFVAELDLGRHPHWELVENVGVQAVVAAAEVTIVGSTVQRVRDARFVGSEIGAEFRPMVSVAEAAAEPALRTWQGLGYRGFLVMDVLVARDRIDGGWRGFNIDPNARFSGGTPLLSVGQHAAAARNGPVGGVMYTTWVPAPYASFDGLAALCADDLFLGAASGHTGLVPLSVGDVVEGARAAATTISVAPSRDEARAAHERFKQRARGGH